MDATSNTTFSRPRWAPYRKMRGWASYVSGDNRIYVKRGGPESLGRYGQTMKSASNDQAYARAVDRFKGPGMYMGVGRYKRRAHKYTHRRIRRLRSGRMRMRGRGGYFGKLFGRILGTPFGLGDAGEKFGDSVGDSVSNWFKGKASDAGHHLAAKLHNKINGRGEYTVNSTVDHPESAPSVPTFHDVPDMSIVKISHREYLGEVYGPPTKVNFQNTIYALNPGVERTFPWLSQIAANFEEYTLDQCMFTFRSTVADFASATGQVGQVIAATQYNATAQPFTDKAAMMQYDGAMSTKTSQSMLHGVECDPRKLSGAPGKFIRVAPVLAAQDLNEYDHGVFNIAVADIPQGYANQSLGELWISYTVELRKPRFWTGRGFAISRDTYQQRNAYTYIRPFGNVASVDYLTAQQNSIGTTLRQYDATTLVPAGLQDVIGVGANSTGAQVAAFSVTFPANYAGTVRVTLLVNIGSAFPISTYAAYGQGNIQGVKDLPYGANNLSGVSGATGTVTQMLQVFECRIGIATGGVNNTLFFVPASGSAATQNAMIDICEYNTSINYKQDGTNDSVVWVNQSGTVTI